METPSPTLPTRGREKAAPPDLPRSSGGVVLDGSAQRDLGKEEGRDETERRQHGAQQEGALHSSGEADPDGGENLVRNGRRPRYSPDGSWITYWTGFSTGDATAPGSNKIFVIPARGGAPRTPV